MKYRVLGRTGFKVSELGFGGHEYRRRLHPSHFPEERSGEDVSETQPRRNKLIENALEAGVNFFDTTILEEAESLGLALKSLGRRRDVRISAMIISPFKKMEELPKTRWREMILEGRLRALQTDYIDIFNVHMPERSYSCEKLVVSIKVLEELRKQGKISWIGASSHDSRFLVELMRRHDCFDSVMVRYNFHLQEAREAIFPLAKALEVGVVVMKPLAWPYYGIPFVRFGPVEGEEGFLTPSQISLRWILGFPEVSTVVPGMNNQAELEENLDAFKKSGEVDENVLDRYFGITQGPEAKEKLRGMLTDPAMDIRCYAEKTLKEIDDSE